MIRNIMLSQLKRQWNSAIRLSSTINRQPAVFLFFLVSSPENTENRVILWLRESKPPRKKRTQDASFCSWTQVGSSQGEGHGWGTHRTMTLAGAVCSSCKHVWFPHREGRQHQSPTHTQAHLLTLLWCAMCSVDLRLRGSLMSFLIYSKGCVLVK